MKLTNVNNISTLMSVWLVNDEYDHDSRPNVISATSLLKSPRQIILAGRAQSSGLVQGDVMDNFAARLGTAIHSAIEQAWLHNKDECLKVLGFPKRVRERIVINPKTVEEDQIPIYLELRSEKKLGKWIISGCADAIFDGELRDIKSTGTWKWLKGDVQDYVRQLSIYKWLNPDKVTSSRGHIDYLFKDWQQFAAKANPKYPSCPVKEQAIDLMDDAQTEAFIAKKLHTIEHYFESPDEDIPECTDEELWRDPPKYQYFGSITSQKASKNFDTHHEANTHLLVKGKGLIKIKPSKAKACNFCNARFNCQQYVRMLANKEIA